MDFTNIPTAFQSKVRLAILAALLTGPKDFTTLCKITEATSGNLGRQLELLEEADYISTQKVTSKKRNKTIYELTPPGKRDFWDYYQLLQQTFKAAGAESNENPLGTEVSPNVQVATT
jgi:DNA-binding HxlR family transcriptional regulator